MTLESSELFFSDECATPKFSQQSLLPVEFFSTDTEFYLFDINHVCFLEVKEIVYKIASILSLSEKNYYDLIKILPEYSPHDVKMALEEISEIQKQGYLKLSEFKRPHQFVLSEIIETLNHKLPNLYLNITSKCNLQCSYCIFGGDYDHHSELQQKEMTWETAQKAIAFFLPRARKDSFLRVDFFGGEPFMAFELMNKIVNRLKEEAQYRNQELKISISSNGTLMNDQIVDFLIKNDVYFQISLDGDKDVQNANRKFRGSDKGSFDTILNNLQLIYKRNPDYFNKRLSLKGVITTESIDKDETEFFDIPLIKSVVERNEFSLLNQRPHFDLKKDADFFTRLHKLGQELLLKKGAATRKELLEGMNFKKRFLFHLTFLDFFQVQLGNSLYYEIDEPVPFTKDCMIGFEGCINCDGSISVCYKSDTFTIGNVYENTYYYDKIEEFYNKRYSLPQCKYCYVQRFCDFCYDKVNGKSEELQHSISNFCEFKRYYYRIIFTYMLKVMENNPGLWDELQQDAENASLKINTTNN